MHQMRPSRLALRRPRHALHRGNVGPRRSGYLAVVSRVLSRCGLVSTLSLSSPASVATRAVHASTTPSLLWRLSCCCGGHSSSTSVTSAQARLRLATTSSIPTSRHVSRSGLALEHNASPQRPRCTMARKWQFGPLRLARSCPGAPCKRA